MRIFILAMAFVAAACTSEAPSPPAMSGDEATKTSPANRPTDDQSFANAADVRIKHLALDLSVDFDRRILEGQARLLLEGSASELVLDTRDLEITAVISPSPQNDSKNRGVDLQWQLGAPQDHRGSPLTIQLPEGSTSVLVAYRTSPDASGLQWLTPAQTAGGKHPFLFSQSQAIHARSWVPLQDTPQVRFTYQATIHTPQTLRAVMSANNNPQRPENGIYQFEMPQPIPSYLMALAVGDLKFQPMSDRTGIYAEAPLLEAAAWEFADTESMMQVGERLFGPYRWGRYDLLILPPSFPFGGMENPRLSFITPTVIAGDRSLVALIAHELAHSWSGNLVTNATWEDLWLNESFTVYLESRIMEAVFSSDRRAMEDVLGYQTLVAELATLPEDDQHLKLELAGRDPDDAFSAVAYEKGRFMLDYLEAAFGREVFDGYLREYFDRHSFQSLTTADFLTDIDTHLLTPNPDIVSLSEIEAWIYQPGLPDNAVLPQSDAFVLVDAQRRQWQQDERAASELDIQNWTVHEWLYFINNLPALTPDQMTELDAAFNLTATNNNEIAHSWLLKAISHEYQPAYPRIEQYLKSIGRNKLIVPIYEALMNSDWGMEMATRVYQEARQGYHPLSQSRIDSLVLQPAHP